MFSNGQEVLEFFDMLLEKCDESQNKICHPVSLLLLDINMPILNGMDTLRLVKEKNLTSSTLRDPVTPKRE